MPRNRLLKLVAFCFTLPVLCGAFAIAQTVVTVSNETPVTATLEVDQLIKQLDANEFAARERAMQQLMKVGLPAIRPLCRAAKSKSLEQSHRSLTILEHYLQGEETISLAAEEALRLIAAPNQTWTGQRAYNSLQQIRTLRQPNALKKLVSLGAEVLNEATDQDQQLALLYLVIRKENWRGTPEDLKQLRNLPALQSISIFGPVANEDQLVEVLEQAEVPQLNLYGTKISKVGQKLLTLRLPMTQIDLRNGGMLGIAGDTLGVNGCMINSVQPNSAAEAAGLEPADVITQIDDQPIKSFPELTAYISEKSGGDQVRVQVLRGEETLNKQVTLGQWAPEHLKNSIRSGNTIILQNGQRIIIGR